MSWREIILFAFAPLGVYAIYDTIRIVWGGKPDKD